MVLILATVAVGEKGDKSSVVYDSSDPSFLHGHCVSNNLQ